MAVGFCWQSLPGRASQGRGSRSSSKGKAAAGGPAACTKSYVLKVSWPLISAGYPCQEELRKAAEAEAAEKERRLQVDRRRTLNYPTCSDFHGRWFLLAIPARKSIARPRKQKQQKSKGGFRWTAAYPKSYVRLGCLPGRAPQGGGGRGGAEGAAASGVPVLQDVHNYRYFRARKSAARPQKQK